MHSQDMLKRISEGHTDQPENTASIPAGGIRRIKNVKRECTVSDQTASVVHYSHLNFNQYHEFISKPDQENEKPKKYQP